MRVPPRDSSAASGARSFVTERDGKVRIALRVKPRASRSKILGVREGELEIAVASPPVDGAANEEVCAVVAKALGVPKSAAKIVTGATGRNKVIEVDGIEAALATTRLVGAGTD
ncbi:MAG: DUF167 domain-containing protein [Polyangiaceae bacterium]|nr:DUF167 domain-containing protein [Polyangiaceae bacterium]